MAEQVLTTRGLTKRYGHALAADHIDLDLERGQIYGLVGRNGAGDHPNRGGDLPLWGTG